MIQHLAVVMDGNRRWARKHKLDVLLGHRKGGLDAARRAVKFCLDNAIKYLSLYTFSLENFNRTDLERTFLFKLLEEVIDQGYSEFSEQEISVHFVGDRSLFPQQLNEKCERFEEQTKQFDRLHLNILFCYGSRQEITSAVKRLVQKVQSGDLAESDISDDMVKQHLWTSNTPEPELIIRTGGVKRLSNFLLYQAAYSEFCFLDCLWPDITEKDLMGALTDFKTTKRNFGT